MNAITAPPAIPTAADIHRERVRTSRAVARLVASTRAVETTKVAEGSRGSYKRQSMVDPLVRLKLTIPCWNAARVYRQAYEHLQAGRGLGPMPWGKDEGGSGGDILPAQMRALSAAVMYRRGVQALGLVAAEGVVHWVVIAGLPLFEYDRRQGWANGRASGMLVAALERLAGEYGT